MNIEQALLQRCNSTCELCSADSSLVVYQVPPAAESSADNCIMICARCHEQINDPEKMEANHWRCLSGSMWSTVPAVQVMAWRLLKRLSAEGWAQDLLDTFYLDEETQKWADAGSAAQGDEERAPTLDSNGAELKDGDTVTIIKDLDVKGANFTAKRGTAVRNISLTSNPEQIEGRVNGVRIVLLSCYLKKSS